MMVIESGAIFTAIVLPLAITYAIGSNASIAITGALDPIAVSVYVIQSLLIDIPLRTGIGSCFYCHHGWYKAEPTFPDNGVFTSCTTCQ